MRRCRSTRSTASCAVRAASCSPTKGSPRNSSLICSVTMTAMTTGRSSTKCPMRWSMTTRVTAAGQPFTGTVPTARVRSSPASRVEGIEAKCKIQGPHITSGLFDKDRLEVNVTDGTVTCPAGVTVSIGRSTDGGLARFAEVCSSRALRPQCTKAAGGRSILVRPSEAVPVRARACHAPQGRAQACPSHAPQARGTTSKGERLRASRRRLQVDGCHCRPGAPREPRRMLDACRMDRGRSLKGHEGLAPSPAGAESPVTAGCKCRPLLEDQPCR